MLTQQLKFKYKLLTHSISLLCFLPSIVVMFKLLPVFEYLEENYPSGVVALFFLFGVTSIILLNTVTVYFSYRAVFKKLHPVSNKQFWELAWCRWYPEHWLK